MNSRNFFRWVWRLNGLIILGGGLIILAGGLITVALVAYEAVDERLRERSDARIITNVADDPQGQEKWVLGYPTQFHSSEYIAIPLVSENNEVQVNRRSQVSNFYLYTGISKNILFVNGKLNESQWLFSGNDQLIDNFTEFPRASEEKDSTTSKSLVFYEVIVNDTNNDGVLTKADKANLAVSGTDGKNYQTIIENIDHVLTQESIDDSQILIIYQKEGVGHSLILQVSDFSVIRDDILPKVGGE